MGWQLFITFGAAFIGSTLGPSFLYYLNKRGREKELTLQQLNEVYKLAKDMESFGKRFPVTIMLMIAIKKGFIKEGQSIPTKQDEHSAALMELLDYHLEPPKELLNKIEIYQKPIAEAYTLIAETFEPQGDAEKNFGLAMGAALTVKNNSPEACSEICSWAKKEKENIENEPTAFNLKFWQNKFNGWQK